MSPRSLFWIAALGVPACGRVGFSHRGDARVDGAPDAVATCPGVDAPPDEDHDLVGDPCDVCPHIPDPGQADGDGDGVGDACDPEPAMPRQRIAFFDGFNGDEAAWSTDASLAGGQLVADVAAADSTSSLAIPTGLSTVTIAGTIRDVGDLASTPQMYLASDAGNGDIYYVELIDEGPGRRRSLMEYVGSAYTELDTLQETQPIQPGPFTLSLTVGTDELAATALVAGGPPAMLGATGTGTIDGQETVVYIDHLAVVLDYAIQIVTVP